MNTQNRLLHSFLYAFIAAFPGMIIGIILGMLANENLSLLNYLSYVFSTTGMVLGMKAWRDKVKGGNMTYGQCMGYGFWYVASYSTVMALFTFIYMKFIADPAVMEMAMAKAQANMEAKNMPASQIEVGMKWARVFTQAEVIAPLSLLFNLIGGTIVSLIVSAFVRKDRDPFQQQQDFYQQQQPLQ